MQCVRHCFPHLTCLRGRLFGERSDSLGDHAEGDHVQQDLPRLCPSRQYTRNGEGGEAYGRSSSFPSDLTAPAAVERSDDLVGRDMLDLGVIVRAISLRALVDDTLEEELGLEEPTLRARTHQ
jgi:hypothetical protein